MIEIEIEIQTESAVPKTMESRPRGPALPSPAAHWRAVLVRPAVLVLGLFLASPTADGLFVQAESEPEPVSMETAAAAAQVVGLEYTETELAAMLMELRSMRAQSLQSRTLPLAHDVLPAIQFTPLAPGIPYRPSRLAELGPSLIGEPESEPGSQDVARPKSPDDLAFADIPTLSRWIRARAISCEELAEFFIARLRRLDPQLHCVVSFTEERALAQARVLDAELEAGHWRGPLHGIPWGAKDLLAVKQTRTTWGAAPYKDQVIDVDATVVRRLDEAGAVLIAKLSLGALAYGDIWFEGTTRNPWKPEQGSSGSSAGPASAVAAGAVPFAIGSETYGSLVSPSNRCGVSSLRPTFGRVSRHGAMPLVWSMDKLGPMARSLDGAALVFDVLHGPDGLDPTVHDLPFDVPGHASVEGLVVGVPMGAFEGFPLGEGTLEELRALGLKLVEVELPDVSSANLNAMLMAESAAAFDELTRSNADDELAWQAPQAWPNLWRATQLLPAVDYINASRRRSLVMLEMDAVMAQVDVLVHAPFAANNLLITNHTGHPVAVAPAGFADDGTPFALSFTGRLFDETTLLAVAAAWQRAGNAHLKRPTLGDP